MIELCKIMHAEEKAARKNFFSFAHNTMTRSPLMKLLSNGFGTYKRRWHFTQHMNNLWNSLPQDAATVTRLDGIKRGLSGFAKVFAILFVLEEDFWKADKSFIGLNVCNLSTLVCDYFNWGVKHLC